MTVTILDGGIGQELVRRHGGRPTPLWSTQVMVEQPGLVGDLHRDFFAAGAEIATTNTYAVLPDRFTGTALDGKVEQLLEAALGQAEAARADYPGRRIAGALGPLRATYRPELCPPVAQAAAEYAPNVAFMKDRVDLFLLETMTSVTQAEGALRAAMGHGVPVWLALSVDDEDGRKLRSGEPLQDLAALLERQQPDAVLLNCSRPEAISAGLAILAEMTPVFGAYANGFTRISDGFKADSPTVDALQVRVDLGPDAYAEFAERWAALGATIIGGCCEVGPTHIAALKRRLG